MTEAGRWTQAAVILRDTGNAEFMLRALWNQIKKLNAQGTKLYGAKWVEIKLTQAEENLLRATVNNGTVEQTAWDSVLEDIHKRIAREIPTTNVEKFNAWRRMAMLLNSKTHLRNVIGNIFMKMNATAKYMNAVALEKLFIRDKNLITHALYWKDNPVRVATVIASWDAIRADMLGEHKYDVDTLSAFHREKRIFKNKQLEALNVHSA